MSKFKVGDRVRIYGLDMETVESVFNGTVYEINGVFLKVYVDELARNYEVNAKQCRNLKPVKNNDGLYTWEPIVNE